MDNRNEIREFLTSTRARITPEQAGLPAYGGNRRVSGLRREEAALLAGVSVEYYTRLERGNLGGVSERVLEALARALRLTRPSVGTCSILSGRRARRPSRDAVRHSRRETEIQPKQPSVKGPAEIFTGDVWYDVIAKGEEPCRIRFNIVRFAPGARNAWHCHAVGQTLHVTEGRGLIQSRGGEVVEIRPGQTIYTRPGEWWHWHGAAPDHFMPHLAMWEGPGEGQGPETEWGDLVTDEEYGSK